MPTSPAASPRALLELDDVADRLARVLELSTADATEIAWVESVGGMASTGPASEPGSAEEIPHRRTVMIRAREGSRRGSHRTGSAEPAEILAGVRAAVAVSRAAEPLPEGGVWSEGEGAEGEDPERAPGEAPALWAPEIAALDPPTARDLLRGPRSAVRPGEHLALEWTLHRVVVATSAGVDRRAEATAATLRARSGDGTGDGEAAEGREGRASAAARSLRNLDPAGLLETARERGVHGDDDGPAADPPDPSAPILFAPEAAAELVAVLARTAFSASAWGSRRSPLAGLRGEHVFAPTVDLVDDGLHPAGLPFPFDLLGRPKKRLVLVEGGVPRTPAVDEALAARLRRPPTPHAVGPDDARPSHVFLAADGRAAGDVLAAAEGGLWVGGLGDLECFDPGRVAVRARLLGARRVRGGELAEPVGPLVWEDSVLRMLSTVIALGAAPAVRAVDAGLGAVSAPMLCVEGAEVLRRG